MSQSSALFVWEAEESSSCRPCQINARRWSLAAAGSNWSCWRMGVGAANASTLREMARTPANRTNDFRKSDAGSQKLRMIASCRLANGLRCRPHASLPCDFSFRRDTTPGKRDATWDQGLVCAGDQCSLIRPPRKSLGRGGAPESETHGTPGAISVMQQGRLAALFRMIPKLGVCRWCRDRLSKIRADAPAMTNRFDRMRWRESESGRQQPPSR